MKKNKTALRNFLDESNNIKVSSKYFLTKKDIERIKSWKSFEKPLENIKKPDDTYIGTFTTTSGKLTASVKLIDVTEFYDKNYINYEGKVIRRFTPREAYRFMGLK